MINIDIENKPNDVKIDGVAAVILTELTFVISFLYLFFRNRGVDVEEIWRVMDATLKEGMKKGWETEKKEKGIDGSKKFI